MNRSTQSKRSTLLGKKIQQRTFTLHEFVLEYFFTAVACSLTHPENRSEHTVCCGPSVETPAVVTDDGEPEGPGFYTIGAPKWT